MVSSAGRESTGNCWRKRPRSSKGGALVFDSRTHAFGGDLEGFLRVLSDSMGETIPYTCSSAERKRVSEEKSVSWERNR